MQLRGSVARRSRPAVVFFTTALTLVATSMLAHADSGPEADHCTEQAVTFADQATPSHPTGEDVAAAAVEGAIVGGLAGPGPGDWSVRGSQRGARVGGGLAALDQLDRREISTWQSAFDEAYTACMAGAPLTAPSDRDCRSSGVVVGTGQTGIYGASSRRNCR